jgi:hypothetical protein
VGSPQLISTFDQEIWNIEFMNLLASNSVLDEYEPQTKGKEWFLMHMTRTG